MQEHSNKELLDAPSSLLLLRPLPPPPLLSTRLFVAKLANLIHPANDIRWSMAPLCLPA